MNKTVNDPEAVALSKIYALLIRKSEQHKREQAQKKVTAVSPAATIPGDKIQSTKKDLS